MIIAIYAIIIGCLCVSEYQEEQELISSLIQGKKAKASKSEAQQFYSSAAWRKARTECFKLQMQRTGLNFIECEICGSTSMDLDDSGKR